MLQIVQTAPCCSFLKLINKLIGELDIEERRGGVPKKNIVFHFKKNCRKHQNDPITTGLTGFVLKQAFKKQQKRKISQHVMLQPDHFVISNISKHLAQKKTPHFVPGI